MAKRATPKAEVRKKPEIVKRGDFILVDFIAKVKETGEVFDTTKKEEAEKAGIFREGAVYEPMLVIVGEGWVLPGLDEQLPRLKVGKEAMVEVPPEKGTGLRDPSKVKLLPIRYFKDTIPRPGMTVEVDGKLAVVRAVGAGRVQIDFNPPLAGKTLVYDIIVRGVLRTDLEKMEALIHRRCPTIGKKEFKVHLTENKVTIEVPEKALSLEGFQYIKRGIASDIHRYVPDFTEVSFIESYVKKVEEAKS